MQTIMLSVLALVVLVVNLTVTSPVPVPEPINHLNHSIPASAQWHGKVRAHDYATSDSDEAYTPGTATSPWKWWNDFTVSRGCDDRPSRLNCMAEKQSHVEQTVDDDLDARQLVDPLNLIMSKPCAHEIAEKYGDKDLTKMTPPEKEALRGEIFDCMYGPVVSSKRVISSEGTEPQREGRCETELLLNLWLVARQDFLKVEHGYPASWYWLLVACLKKEPGTSFNPNGSQGEETIAEFIPAGTEECLDEATSGWEWGTSTEVTREAFVFALRDCIKPSPTNATAESASSLSFP